MTARLRITVAALISLLIAGAPALAQDAAQQQASVPPQNAVVGPPQLKDFTLNGTVTRQASQPPRNQPSTQPPARSPAQATAQQQTQRGEATPAPRMEAPAPAAPRERVQVPAQVQPDAAPPDDAATAPAGALAATHDSLPAAPVDVASPAPPATGVPLLPWIIAALVAAAAAGWLLVRRLRPRESYAGISDFEDIQAPSPVARETAPAAPAPAKPAAEAVPPPAPGGVVSTRLRPWLEIEFNPDRAVVDDNRAAVAFEISVMNSGSVPARDVLLEASLFNAGPMQDQQIKLFFDNPVGKGDRIPVIPPMQRVTVNTAVFLPRDQVRPIEMEGRILFVPMVAFNALYRWSGGDGQTSASYLVGKETNGDKLAPFRLDLGPRIFRGLAGREHELKVRS